MRDTSKFVLNVRQSIKNDTFLYILLSVLNFRHWKLHCSPIILHVRVALGLQLLFAVGAKPFATNENDKYEYFDRALQIFQFLSVVYDLFILYNIIDNRRIKSNDVLYFQ